MNRSGAAFPLLTRRETLQSLAFSAVFGGSLFNLVGCGGGGGHHGGGSSADSASVAVQLPSGFPIAATDLQAGTAYGTGAVSKGTFKAKISSKGPTFAYLQQKSTGKYVLFGLVGHGRPGLSTLSSAAFLMAVALGISGLPPKNLGEAMALLETNGDVQALATTISATLASDPLCLTNGNATVVAAVKTAVSAVGHGVAPTVARPVSRADTPPPIFVQPSGDQGGAVVEQGDDGYVVPKNTKRRPISVYTYRVGHVAADGTTTPISPALRINQQDIESTASIAGSVTSLFTKVAFGPVEGTRIALDVSSGDTRTLYETVVLMATGDNAAADPAFFADPKYANESTEWRAKLGELNVYAFLGGIVFDLFKSVLGGAATALSFVRLAQIAATAQAAGDVLVKQVLDAAARGALGDAFETYLERVAEGGVASSASKEVGLELLGLTEEVAAHGAAGVEGAALGGVAASALLVLAAVGTIGGVVDVAASYYDVLFSPKGELWTETALKPSVVISPATGTVPAGSSLTLSAGTPGVSETLYKFRWTLSSGGNGYLNDPTGTAKPGRDLTTTGNSISLVTAPSDTEDTEYAVTVEAIEIKTGASLGKTKATLTVGPNVVYLPTTRYIYKSPNQENGYYVAHYYAVFQPVQNGASYSLAFRAGPNDPQGGPGEIVNIAETVYAKDLPIKDYPDGTVIGNALYVTLDIGKTKDDLDKAISDRLAGSFGARQYLALVGFSA